MGMYRIALTAATLLTVVSTGPISAANTSGGPVPKNAGSWITTADYPPEARSEKRTGKTGFRLKVSSKGQVETCEVIASSGHPDLDHIACLRISERAVFEPARTAKGRRTAGVYQNAVRWQLP